MKHDDWLEQPRVEADAERLLEEGVDQLLGEEFDKMLRTAQGAADAVRCLCDHDKDWLAEIAHATSSRSPHTVETAVAAMLDAARAQWIRAPANRERFKRR